MLSDTKIFLGSRLKKIRKFKSLTLVRFGYILGCSDGYLSAVENGIKSLSIDSLICLKDNLNVNISWLLTGEGEMFIKDAGTGSQELIDSTINIMKNMDKKSQEDVLRYVEKERLLSALLEERKRA